MSKGLTFSGVGGSSHIPSVKATVPANLLFERRIALHLGDIALYQGLSDFHFDGL
jgi:hypothetical protein